MTTTPPTAVAAPTWNPAAVVPSIDGPVEHGECTSNAAHRAATVAWTPPPDASPEVAS